MSKIGKLPVKLPEKVTAEINGKTLMVKGPLGELTRIIPRDIEVEIKDGIIFLTMAKKDIPNLSAIYGTTRALVANMVNGVSTGWKKVLELVGAGYKAEVSGKDLILTVGFSHTVKIHAPEGINFKVEKTFITIDGADRETVGETAAKIRKVRPPEPYKGKGIKYQDEVIRRKAGKAAKTAGGPA
jgi:large subunit ribosomal protein L6